MKYVWDDARRAELANLWHLSRTALSKPGPLPTTHDRMLWTSEEYHKQHPECSLMAAYKELDSQGAVRVSVQVVKRRAYTGSVMIRYHPLTKEQE